jgi:hypothetical protein
LQKKIQEKLEEFKEGSWHRFSWKPSGWRGLRDRAISKNLRPQDAIDELWQAAGEGRIKATALEYKNAKAFDGEIPADHWPHLKRADDQLTGKAMLSDDQGRVYREVKFLRLDVKKLWPKSPPLSGEPLIEPGAVEVLPELPEPERVEAPEPTRPAEPELLEPKARPTPESPQSKRAERYIKKHYPDGTDGVSTPAIRRKFLKDKDLQAELEKEGGIWGVPSQAVINRVLNRRLK